MKPMFEFHCLAAAGSEETFPESSRIFPLFSHDKLTYSCHGQYLKSPLQTRNAHCNRDDKKSLVVSIR